MFSRFSVGCILELECDVRATDFLGSAESLLMECDVIVGYDMICECMPYINATLQCIVGKTVIHRISNKLFI